MDAILENPVEEVKRHQRCINDLVGILALPAVWAGGEPSKIVGTLLDSLVSMLDLDFAYLRLSDPFGGVPIEMVRIDQSRLSTTRPNELGEMLKHLFKEEPQKWPPSVRMPVGNGEVSIAPRRLGLQGEIGVIIAGSPRLDFPLQTEALLLDVAANQAIIALRQAQNLSEQQQFADELDQLVTQRTAQLAAANEELKLRAGLLQHIPVAAFTLKPDGTPDFVNENWLSYSGQTLEFVRSKPDAWMSAVHLDDRESNSKCFWDGVRSGQGFAMVSRLRRHTDGAYRWHLNRAVPLRDAEGRVLRFVGTSTDIEDLKQSQESLRKTEERAQMIIDTALDAVVSMDAHGSITSWNREAEVIFGWSKEEAIGRQMDELIVPEHQRAAYTRGLGHFLATAEGPFLRKRIEFTAVRRKGVEFPVELEMLPMKLDQAWFFSAFMRDITARKQAESAKAAQVQLAGVRADVGAAFAQAEHIRTILNSCAEAIVRHLGAAFARIWTLNENENMLVLQASAGLYTALDGTHARVPVGQLKIGRIAEERKPHLTNDVLNDERVSDRDWARREGMVAFAGYPLFVEGRVIGVMAMFARCSLNQSVLDALESVADIIAQGIFRKDAQDKLRRSEAYLAEAQRLGQIGSYSWRVATDEITWSDELYRIYQVQIGTPVTLELIRARVHPEDLTLYEKMVEEAPNGGNDFEWEYRLLMPDHTIKYLHAIAHATRDENGQLEYIAAIQDVTARCLADQALARARSELARVSRVTSLAGLTASIAHEVNQPLAAVVTNAHACLRWLDHPEANLNEAREAVQHIIRDGNRGSEVIGRIRALVKNEPPARRSINLNEIIEETVELVHFELHGTELKLELTNQLPFVIADRVQLQQVLLNLMMNAIDAMESVSDRPRVLLLETKPFENDTVLVAVQDSGAGLQPGKLDNLFETFYTTKPQGLGMGLSISRSIIESHGGRLWAKCNNGPGATFQFSLPADKGGSG